MAKLLTDGPVLVNAALAGGSLSHLHIYIAGPLVGGVLAALAFRVQHS